MSCFKQPLGQLESLNETRLESYSFNVIQSDVITHIYVIHAACYFFQLRRCGWVKFVSVSPSMSIVWLVAGAYLRSGLIGTSQGIARRRLSSSTVLVDGVCDASTERPAVEIIRRRLTVGGSI